MNDECGVWTLSARDRGATENPASDLELIFGLHQFTLGSLKYLYNKGANKRPLVSASSATLESTPKLVLKSAIYALWLLRTVCIRE